MNDVSRYTNFHIDIPCTIGIDIMKSRILKAGDDIIVPSFTTGAVATTEVSVIDLIIERRLLKFEIT